MRELLRRDSVKFCDIYKETAQLMCHMFGFQKIEFEHTYALFGGDNIASTTKRHNSYHTPYAFRQLAKELSTKLMFPTLDLPPMCDETKALLEQFEKGEIERVDLWKMEWAAEEELDRLHASTQEAQEEQKEEIEQ